MLKFELLRNFRTAKEGEEECNKIYFQLFSFSSQSDSNFVNWTGKQDASHSDHSSSSINLKMVVVNSVCERIVSKNDIRNIIEK